MPPPPSPTAYFCWVKIQNLAYAKENVLPLSYTPAPLLKQQTTKASLWLCIYYQAEAPFSFSLKHLHELHSLTSSTAHRPHDKTMWKPIMTFPETFLRQRKSEEQACISMCLFLDVSTSVLALQAPRTLTVLLSRFLPAHGQIASGL